MCLCQLRSCSKSTATRLNDSLFCKDVPFMKMGWRLFDCLCGRWTWQGFWSVELDNIFGTPVYNYLKIFWKRYVHRCTLVVQLQHGKTFRGLDIRVKSIIVVNMKKEQSWSQYWALRHTSIDWMEVWTTQRSLTIIVWLTKVLYTKMYIFSCST